MRRTWLLTLLIGSLGLLPSAYAQALMENAGIGAMHAGAAGGFARAGAAIGGAHRAVGRAVAGETGGEAVVHRGGARRHNSRRGRGGAIILYPGGYAGDYEAEPAPTGSVQGPIRIEGSRESTVAQLPATAPKVTELPEKRGASSAKPAPPAIFVLKSGERIEAERYIVTSRQVQLTADRQQRTIPLSLLNIDETVATNRKRGLNLRVPSESGIVSLGF